MLVSVFGKRVWDRRRGYVWWMIGLGTLTLITVGFWPTIATDTEALASLIESMPSGFLGLFGASDAAALLTPAGYVNSRLYASIGAIVICLFAASMGTAAIAGEENDGTMNLLLAQPVARGRIVLESFASMALMTFGLALGMMVIVLILNPIVNTDLSFSGLAAATVGVTLLGIVFGALALAIGGSLGGRPVTIGVSAGAVLATWFINGLAPLVDQLAWAQKLTPFFWFLDSSPLENGFSAGSLVNVAIAAALVAVAIWGFDRRDVAV